MSLLVVGTLAYDTIETVRERRENLLGGSATHFAAAAANFTPVRLVGVVGRDFEQAHLAALTSAGVDCSGVEVAAGKTFRWGGRYSADGNTRQTLFTELNVFEHFDPKIPADFRDSRFVFLANAAPRIQERALDQCPDAGFTVADTMNLWIDTARDELLALLGRVDGVVLNDEEARMLSGESNLIRAARAVQKLGPRYVILKKGEHGAFLIGEDTRFALPSYPVEELVDPTGAGDSFAGGFMGYLAASESLEPRTLRRALLYGTVTASFCVEGFGTEGLLGPPEKAIGRRARRTAIESRFNELLDITSI
jgi:sugar/nucleoside kinase (ribokinase family)